MPLRCGPVGGPRPPTARSLYANASREQQQRARIFGVLFALTFVTAIAALLLYDPVLNDADYILGDGAATRVQLGALCEIFLAITNIGTAVVIWPIVRRQSETLAQLCRQPHRRVGDHPRRRDQRAVGLDPPAGGHRRRRRHAHRRQQLVALHDWTFLMGPGFCVAVGNGMLLGYAMYKSGLVPRQMALLGLIGGPLLFASSAAVLFGAYEQTSGPRSCSPSPRSPGSCPSGST